MKKAHREMHCALAVVMRIQQFSPCNRPLPGRGMAKI